MRHSRKTTTRMEGASIYTPTTRMVVFRERPKNAHNLINLLAVLPLFGSKARLPPSRYAPWGRAGGDAVEMGGVAATTRRRPLQAGASMYAHRAYWLQSRRSTGGV